MKFLADFHTGSVDLESINRALIVLLPKKAGATAPADFRPISLQNCPVKILTKILTTRLQNQIQSLVDIDQTGFIRGRSISENFVYATELVLCCHRRRQPTIVLKLASRRPLTLSIGTAYFKSWMQMVPKWTCTKMDSHQAIKREILQSHTRQQQ